MCVCVRRPTRDRVPITARQVAMHYCIVIHNTVMHAATCEERASGLTSNGHGHGRGLSVCHAILGYRDNGRKQNAERAKVFREWG